MDVIAAPARTIDLASEPPFRVGGASVDPVTREATFDGGNERLQPQNLKVLVALARARGTVVTRDELIELCWDGRVIGDDVINRAISTLRQFAKRVGGFEIETFPRAGYLLVDSSSRREQLLVRGRIIAISAIVVAVAAALLLLIRSQEMQKPPAEFTVAVLPFTSDSADATTRKLAFAVQDSVAHALSLSRFSVKTNVTSANIARRSDFLLSANVSSIPGRFVVTVRVEDASNHIIVYSHRFESASGLVWNLPDQIGPQVAGSIGWASPLLILNRRHPSDPAVTAELFEEAVPTSLDALRSYETARRIAAKAPHSAVAQLAVAFRGAFALSDLPRDQRAAAVALARRAQERAEQLAPEFGDAHAPWCLLHSEIRRAECEDRLRDGLRADPDSPFTDFFLSQELIDVGRMREGADLAMHSLGNDQYIPAKIGLALRTLEAAGRSNEAEKLYGQGVRWWPEFPLLAARVSGMIDRGDFGAIIAIESAIGRKNLPEGYDPLSRLALAVKSNSISDVRIECPEGISPSLKVHLCIIALARLGDLDRAYALVDVMYPRRVGRTPIEEDQIWLDSPFTPGTEYLSGAGAAQLRQDSRFVAVAQRTGLMAYWRRGRLPDFCAQRPPESVCNIF